MANKILFKSVPGRNLPEANTVNNELAPAYAFEPKHALAQYASTGCLNSTFYASAEEQLDMVLNLCNEVDPLFIARTAIYCREQGFMKDIPALLCAVLSVKAPGLLIKIFDRVIDNGKMLRNFVQIMRSGAVGRKSLGSLPKKLIVNWLNNRTDEYLFRASVGNSPSLVDIIKMVHPKPGNKNREALFGYLLGREYNIEYITNIVKKFEEYKNGNKAEVPDVPFQMLTALELGTDEWRQIALNAGWQMTRMNLNTFARHGVFKGLFKGRKYANIVAARLRDSEAIAKARIFPYQLMIAYKMAGENVPGVIRNALQDAMEIATANVPKIEGKVYVCPDVSGSMTWAAVTGQRNGSTSAVRCIDVAALVAASVLRNNPEAKVLPFECDVVKIRINPRDSIMTNSEKLSRIGGGGTNCSAPLAKLNKENAHGDLVVFVSDNESWVDARAGRGTATLVEWEKFKRRNPNARMVCIDIQPYGTTQAKERDDILNIGGFSDSVFDVIQKFSAGELNPAHWIGEIESVEI